VFRLGSLITFLATCVLIYFQKYSTPETQEGIFISLFATIFGVTIMQNCVWILLELRVPPRDLGIIMSLVITLAFGMLFVTPLIDVIDPPVPYYIILTFVSICFVVSFLLPSPEQ